VRVARVRHVSTPVQVKVSGELLPVSVTDVVSRLAGKVTEVRFKVGEFVSAGTVVGVIHASDLGQRMSGLEKAATVAQQDLRLKEEQAAEAKERLTKNRELMRRDLIARRDLEQIETAAKTASAQVDLARAHLASQRAMLAQMQALQSLTRLAAPTSGVISRLLVEPGAAIDEGGAILTLISLETLKFAAKISGSEAGDLRRGMKARVFSPASPGVVSAGKVFHSQQRTNDAQGVFDVEIHIDNRQRVFRPGMAVEALIELGRRKEYLLVPRSAIVRSENNNPFVYKAVDGRVSRQNVVLGPEQGDEVAILHGLEQGATIVVDDVTKLKAGKRILALEEEQEPHPTNQ
jgi:membrane fusion protein (multidrug efflux system)